MSRMHVHAPAQAAQCSLLQRKCTCGAALGLKGPCPDCERKKMLGLQTRTLRVGDAQDAFEQEAERVAGQVMAMPARGGAPTRTTALPQAVQRAGAGAASTGAVPGAVPDAVQAALQGPARPLDAATRAFFEPRFGHDFGHVRVRVDAPAARSVQAQAFTVGERIVFDAARYQPGTDAGRRLLAHELVHVLQQGGAGTLRRKVSVTNPKKAIPDPTGKGLKQSNAETIEGYLRTLCSDGAVNVDRASGAVALKAGFCPPWMAPAEAGPPLPAPIDKAKEQAGCRCLCDMVNSPNAFNIEVNDLDWPNTSGNTVTTPSPNSDKLWGAATVSGKALNIDPWLVLGHEFCGHAWLAERRLPDTNATRGEGGHQETVARENELRKKHGIEARGSFKDPFCGESFFQDKDTGKGKPGPVQWSAYIAKCEAWRKKTYGTKYKISDKIP